MPQLHEERDNGVENYSLGGEQFPHIQNELLSGMLSLCSCFFWSVATAS